MDNEELLLDLEVRMEKVIEILSKDLATIRTGRANAAIFDRVVIDYYGELTPINQISSISVPEARQLLIKPYERDFLRAIEKAIVDANLGLTPSNDGNVIRINIPTLTEERRKEFTRNASKMAEDAKVAVRNIRRDGNDKVKNNKTLSEDVKKSLENDIQKLTDKYVSKIDNLYQEKEKDLMSV